MIIGLSFIVVALLVGIIIWIMVIRRYNKKIVLFKKIGGKVVKVGEDKGTFERVGIAGDYWLRMMGSKKIVARPKLEISKNEFWFYEREDGEWINFVLEDIDKRMKDMNIYYIDEDMRLNRIAIQKNLVDRYKKGGFWEKYGTLISFALFVIIITICLIVLFTKLKDVAGGLSAAAGSMEKLANALHNMNSTSGTVVKL